jgi:hypothetical protein
VAPPQSIFARLTQLDNRAGKQMWSLAAV